MSYLRTYDAFSIAPTRVRVADRPAFAGARQKAGTAKRAGILYQGKVNRLFEQFYGFQYIAEPWFEYSIQEQKKLCSPDGLFIDLHRGRIVIVEVKLSHTAVAFQQLRNKYLPILQAALSPGIVSQGPSGTASVAGHFAVPHWTFYLLEVAPSYDPLQSGGEVVKIVRNFTNLLPAEEGVNFHPLARSQSFNRKIN